MNFQYIPPIETSDHYLDNAFRGARKKTSGKIDGQWIDKVRKKELIKIDVAKDKLTIPLKKILDEFPSFDGLPDFYKELTKLTLDVEKVKHALASVKWAITRIGEFQKMYARKVAKSSRQPEIKAAIKEFYGRVSSVLKRQEKHFKTLNKARKVMRTYPDIKEMFTVCIFGFPNVGKSTLLNTLAKTKAKTAAYAFTTVGINVGYMNIGEIEIQLLDVPGTLARLDKQNLIERQAYAALKISHAVIYVFDVTEPYVMSDQEQLLKTISKSKDVLLYLSKTDLLKKEQISEFKKKHDILSLSQLKSSLKDYVTEFEA